MSPSPDGEKGQRMSGRGNKERSVQVGNLGEGIGMK